MKVVFTHLKYSWKFFNGYRCLFLIDIILKLFSLVTSLFLPILYAELITAISISSTTRAIYVLVFILCFQILSLILSYIVGRLENRLVKNVSCNTQKELEKQIFTMPPYLLREYDDGNLFSIIVRDSVAPISYTFTMVNVLFNIITLLSIGIIIFMISWEMSLVVLCTYPIVYLINKIYGKKLRLKQTEWIKSSDGFVGFLKNIISNIKFIKSNKGEVKISEAFNVKVEDVKAKSSELEILKLNNNTFISILDIINYAAINFIGIILIIFDKLLFSSFVAFNSYSTKFSSSLNGLVSLNANLQPAFVIFQRLEHLDEIYKQSNSSNQEKLSIDSNKKLEINNLSISLAGKQIFDNVTFSIDAGELIHIRGKNGCGKTTILKILLQEYIDYNGIIRIGDTNLHEISYCSIQDNFTFMQQNAPLLPLTLFDNLTLFDSKKCIKEEDVIKTCQEVGLWEDINSLPNGLYTEVTDSFNLSAGQIQKLQFARALLRNSAILLIDEVIANLDCNSTSTILNLCNKIKNEGKIIIYISHINNDDIVAVDKYFDFAC